VGEDSIGSGGAGLRAARVGAVFGSADFVVDADWLSLLFEGFVEETADPVGLEFRPAWLVSSSGRIFRGAAMATFGAVGAAAVFLAAFRSATVGFGGSLVLTRFFTRIFRPPAMPDRR
jgi:hypothetical protein